MTYFGGVQRYGRFSPDGKSIVYCQGASERGPWELYIIPAQGGTPRKAHRRELRHEPRLALACARGSSREGQKWRVTSEGCRD